jgi:hypothetical protein
VLAEGPARRFERHLGGHLIDQAIESGRANRPSRSRERTPGAHSVNVSTGGSPRPAGEKWHRTRVCPWWSLVARAAALRTPKANVVVPVHGTLRERIIAIVE